MNTELKSAYVQLFAGVLILVAALVPLTARLFSRTKMEASKRTLPPVVVALPIVALAGLVALIVFDSVLVAFAIFIAVGLIFTIRFLAAAAPVSRLETWNLMFLYLLLAMLSAYLFAATTAETDVPPRVRTDSPVSSR